MKFKIAEWDKDYHTVVGIIEKEFKDKKEAEAYCVACSGGAMYIL